MIKKLVWILSIVFIMTACGDDEDFISLNTPDEITLEKGEQYQIKASSESAIRYGSIDEYHATVDDNGLITANFVGTTMIRLKNDSEEKYITVGVVPRNTMLVEPYHESFWTQKTEIVKMNGSTYQSVNDNGIKYDVSGKEMGASESFEFYFKNKKDENGKTFHDVLNKVVLNLKAGTDEASLKDFLGERYLPMENRGWTYQDALELVPATVVISVDKDASGKISVTYTAAQ